MFTVILKYLILTELACTVTGTIRTFSFHATDRQPSQRVFAVNMTFGDCSTVRCVQNALMNTKLTLGSKVQFVRCLCYSKKSRRNSMKLWELKIKNREKIPEEKATKLTQQKDGQPKSISQGRRRFGDDCSDHHDCDYRFGWCLRGSCSCNIGYSYNFEKDECVTSCSKYGRSFSKYDNSSIIGCNKRNPWIRSAKACLEKCLAERSFICISVEFGGRIILECNLCNEAWNNIDSKNRFNGTDPVYAIYYRHCEN